MYEVFLKEIKELLRDRKTLMFVVALPLLIFPIIFALIGFLASQAALEAKQEVHTYAIVNAQYAEPFAKEVFFHKSFKELEQKHSYQSIDDLKAAVEAGTIDVGIYIPQDAQGSLDNGEQSTWQVIFNDAQTINFLFTNLKEVADKYAQQLQSAKLIELGVSEDAQAALLQPIELEKVNTADQRENLGEKIGAYIPYLLLPLVLTGAMYPAIDLGAGEKERGTLETLLLTPLSRTQVVLGKFLTVFCSGITSAMVTVLSFGLWITLAGQFIELDMLKEAFGTVMVTDLLLILLLLIPVAAIFGSLALTISIYARSFKEAQNYMSPLSFLVFIPIIVAIMPNMELTAKTALIPITNICLAIKEIIKGTVDLGLVGLIFAATVVLAGALLAFCTYWFNKEDVLFR
ncbi:ABC transporter permease [Pseudoalteromonas ruthenica]|uniref:ABC transporter permease n=1 Tax=Pseudoalteromonas ruthenica TaxID=151081 RepID=UPI00110A32D4|nr:ABC transporter permease [Pseudoalteromonas ruthenica]TMO88256.1 sodium ABC transporter permease [Pseudoalteromonas ruthenica]TMP24193.1 sodium ABC transporter permease [Pseudoalteromonas ruthenica]